MTNEELVYLYQQGNKQILDIIVDNNKGIVYKIANKFYVEGINSIDKEDLEQEGIIGLITAADKYDFDNPNKAKFSTYAVFWIRQRISRYINQRNTNEEVSLNSPLNGEGDAELMDYIEGVDYSFENIEEKIYIKQLHAELDSVMLNYNSLKEREIIKMHYGFDGTRCMTLQEIGDIFNVTGSMINSIENAALRKLRKSPWGRNKAIEIHGQRIENSRSRISDSIENINFAERYLI